MRSRRSRELATDAYSTMPAMPAARHLLVAALAAWLPRHGSCGLFDDEEPVAKKAKVEGKDKKKKKKKSKGSDDDDSVNSDVVEDLSGDEVDTSNIIEGGRRSRKGRATVFTYTATDLAEDSDED